MAAFTYAATLVLLAQALSLMYRTIKAPNFSAGILMVLGAYTGYISTKIYGMPLFLSFPLAFITASAASLATYLLVIKPLTHRGRSPVLITIATIGVMITGEALIGILTIWIRNTFHFAPTSIFLWEYDFKIGALSGVFLVSSLIALTSALILRYLLNHTTLGDSSQPYYGLKNWLLAGGLAGLAGVLMVIRFHVTSIAGSYIMASVFAACLLGGIDNPKGAVMGGLIVGVSEIMVTTLGQDFIGVWFGDWRFIVPLSIMVLVLRFKPDGILGVENPVMEGYNIKWMVGRRSIVLFGILLIAGASFVVACSYNRVQAQNGLIAQFADYDIIVAERNRTIASINVGNLTLFKAKLIQDNITTVYVEPYDSSSDFFTFYYPWRHWYFRTDVWLEYTGICQYRVRN